MQILLFILALFIASSAWGATCTDGTDCYCDKVNGGSLNDSNVLVCEDFEAATLHDDTGVGGGSPLYGPWYDDTGFSGARGANSYWSRTYGSSISGCAWQNGEPTSPVKGTTCSYPLCWPAEWRADDLWGGNSRACIDIVRNGEFNDEIATLTDPTIPGGGAGVFDGQQILSHRIGAGKKSGIIGNAEFTATKEIGITMAVAYPSNSASVNLWEDPWKHNEFLTVTGNDGDGPIMFHNTGSLGENDPFTNFMFGLDATTEAQCNTALTAANKRRGTFQCTSSGLLYQADPVHYTRSTDWPFATWGCVRGHIQNMGTSNLSVKIWFNDTLIIDFDGFDGSILSNKDGYDAFLWNSYANRNQGGSPSTTTTYRYEDNVHIRKGAPVSCEQIGFPTDPSDVTPPSDPTNLQTNVISDTQINLSWTASTDGESGISHYEIYRLAGACGTPTTQIDTSATNSYPSTGLSASTTYCYRVRAVNGAGLPSDNYSNTAQATTQAVIFNFSMSNSGGISVVKSASGQTTITATLVAGTAENLSFSVTSGLPTEATAQFSPTDCTPTCNSTLTINTAGNTETGSSTITVQGTNGVISRTTQFSLTVTDSSQFETTLTPTDDTYLNCNTTNYSSNNDLNLYTWPANKRANVIILQFDTTGIPTNATVTGADLSLVLLDSDATADATYSVGAHKIINVSPVISQATGFVYSTGNNWTGPNDQCNSDTPLANNDIAAAETTLQVDKVNGAKTWSIKAMAQDWVASPPSNRGVLLSADVSKGADRWRSFHSKQSATESLWPTLTITYNIPGAPEDPGSGSVKGGGAMTIRGGAGGQTWR